MTDTTRKTLDDARFAGAVTRITAEINALVAHEVIRPDEAELVMAELRAIDDRRLFEARAAVVDPDRLALTEVTCTLGPDLCAKCWDAALAAEAYARPTGATSGTYRDEQRNSEGVLVVHQGTWSRVDDATGGVVYFGEEDET